MLEPREAPPQHEPVDEDGRERRAGEQRQTPAVGDRVRVQVHDDRRREHGRGDQERVDGEECVRRAGRFRSTGAQVIGRPDRSGVPAVGPVGRRLAGPSLALSFVK
ncbi:MAG TPA: hypothetical protein VHF51_18365 [Solirubrobacteraceae bacterium]|nr:hypothetical protein [Solirubrobacteraceae bacterium]